jgi:hypothetical protein
VTSPTIVWQFVPDVAGRRRLRSQVRFGTLAATVTLVGLAWWVFGVAGGLVAVLVMLTLTFLVEAWGRSTPDDVGPQRIWLDAGELCAEGADVYQQAPGDDGFERDERDEHDDDHLDEQVGDGPMALPVVALTDVAWASVYPATTRADGVEGPPVGHHLVLDLGTRGGGRCCIVFDRRIPFRVAGEVGLVDAVRLLVGDRWRAPPPPDPFGAPDERRLGDWRAVGGIRRDDGGRRRSGVDERLVHELFQLAADGVGARREQLGEEQHSESLDRVDPEVGAGRAAPSVIADRAGHLGRDRVDRDADAESETDPVEGRLGEQWATERAEVGVVRQVVGRHVGDRARRQQACAVELAAAAQHLGEPQVVARRRDEPAAA